MSRQRFALEPFRAGSNPFRLRVEGEARRDGPILEIRFVLSGNLDQVALPNHAPAPERRSGLWEATCLEFFLAAAGEEPYREFNLSPAGHWNVFRFDSYRRGMREEVACTGLPFRVERGSQLLGVFLDLDLAPLGLEARALSAGAAAVILTNTGVTGFWALTHPGREPDFHRRDSHLLNL